MSKIEKSIVQIFSDKTIVDYVRPWSISHKERSTGSGFAIELVGFKKQTKYILTNAHCVNEASYVTVRKQGISRTFRAKIEAIGYEVDQALLSVDSKEFWDVTPPLTFGGIPSKLSKVQVLGYPLGGHNIAITQGVVNRIRIIPYFHVTKGITLQIDAPINFGNSGGPAVNEHGEVIGIAFAGEDDTRTQNMGYIIPTIIVDLFLGNLKTHKSFNGLCSLGIHKQKLNNNTLREFYRLEPHHTGILVSYVEELSAVQGKIKEGDIITKFNNINIDSDGTIAMRDLIQNAQDCGPKVVSTEVRSSDSDKEVEIALASDERVPFNNAMSLQLPGADIKLTILREGKYKEIKIKAKLRDFLVPILPYQAAPSYYIIGGLVFVPLTLMMIEQMIEANDDDSLAGYMGAEKLVEDQQKVVLSDILLTEITDGYKEKNQILMTVNDRIILNLEHLHDVIAEELKKSKFLKFEFENDEDIMVLKSSDAKKYSKSIVSDQLGISNIYVNRIDLPRTSRAASLAKLKKK
jgi:S1-C subfamily serine protease